MNTKPLTTTLMVLFFVACGNEHAVVPGATCTKTEECVSGSVCSSGRCTAITIPETDKVQSDVAVGTPSDPNAPGASSGPEETSAQVEAPPAPSGLVLPKVNTPIIFSAKKPSYDTGFASGATYSYAGARVVEIAQFSDQSLAVLLSNDKIVKLSSSGGLDTSFASNGELSPAVRRISHIEISADRLFVFAEVTAASCTSASSSTLAVFSFDSSGQASTNFGIAGVARFYFGTARAAQIAVSTGGRVDGDTIWLTGHTQSECDGTKATDRSVVVKLSATSGARSSTFATAGTLLDPIVGPSSVTHVVPCAEGVIVVGRYFNALANKDMGLIKRFTHLGAEDSSYKAISLNGNTYTLPRSVLVRDGKLLVMTETRSAPGEPADITLFQALAQGGLDTSFANNGTALLDMPRDLSAQNLIEDAGALYVGVQNGSYFTDGAATKAQIWKLTDNGAFDTSFGTSGIFDVSYGSADAKLGVALFIDAAHRFYVGGATAVGLVVTGKLARFNY